MNIILDLNTIFQGLILFGLVGGIRGVYTRFTKLNDKVDQINGGLKEVKVWQTEHVKLDDIEHGAAKEDRRDLWSAINDIRK
jgi:hypothetical protein|tara:strand:- start:3726 stop:3971 length:246 start_codon:yes stop_codon:yes gene_type:complete